MTLNILRMRFRKLNFIYKWENLSNFFSNLPKGFSNTSIHTVIESRSIEGSENKKNKEKLFSRHLSHRYCNLHKRVFSHDQ